MRRARRDIVLDEESLVGNEYCIPILALVIRTQRNNATRVLPQDITLEGSESHHTAIHRLGSLGKAGKLLDLNETVVERIDSASAAYFPLRWRLFAAVGPGSRPIQCSVLASGV